MKCNKFEVIFYGDVVNCVRDEDGNEYNLQEMIAILNDQQATIEAKERRIMILENLLTRIGVQWVDDDE